MKYIRTYGDYNSWKLDYSDTSRGFRLKPTLYKYSDVNIESKILLETDDPRKHGDSTYMEIDLSSDAEFSFYIGNKSGDTQTTMTCTIDWGDGTIETKTITKDNYGFKLAHNYVANSYHIELYGVERNYSIAGYDNMSLISPANVNFKRAILSESVVNIEAGAFDSQYHLTSIYIPNSVISIGEQAFGSCESLTSVSIPESVTSIGKGVFDGCSSLISINIPNSVTSIGSVAFKYCTSLTSIHIPESVTSIGDSAFNSCHSLTSIYIPESVTSIGNDMFGGCSSLTSINIPNSVNSIGSSMFGGCSSLTSINIPNSVNSIEHNAFEECSSLTSIDIPESVTSIRENAFDGCLLTHISSLNTTAPTIGNDVFANIPTNGTLHIKQGATGYDAWLNALPSGWKIVESL